jgi:hypothetical protein
MKYNHRTPVALAQGYVSDGSCLYYVDGKQHRIDGPAADYKNGGKYYFINDEMIFKWAHLDKIETTQTVVETENNLDS